MSNSKCTVIYIGQHDFLYIIYPNRHLPYIPPSPSISFLVGYGNSYISYFVDNVFNSCHPLSRRETQNRKTICLPPSLQCSAPDTLSSPLGLQRALCHCTNFRKMPIRFSLLLYSHALSGGRHGLMVGGVQGLAVHSLLSYLCLVSSSDKNSCG